MLFITHILYGCKLLSSSQRSQQISSSDSARLKKELETISKVDSNKTKTETTYLKETYIYPPKDTIINNYYPASPAVYIRESGNSKNETQMFNYEQRLKEVTDSIRIAQLQEQLTKKTEIKTSLLSFGETLGLAVLGIVIIVMIIMFMWIAKKVNVINQIKNSI